MSVLENLVAEIPAILADADPIDVSVAGEAAVPVNRGAGLILESESGACLGGEGVASARVLLYSNVPMPQGDRVRVIGRIPEDGQPASFAEVVALHGAELNAEVFYQFGVRHQRLLDQPGVMVRNDKQHIMMRLGRDAAKLGFAPIAATFLARIHEVYPAVEGVDLLFIVGEDALIEKFAELNRGSEQTVTALKEGVWKEMSIPRSSSLTSSSGSKCSVNSMPLSPRQLASSSLTDGVLLYNSSRSMLSTRSMIAIISALWLSIFAA